MTFSDCLRAAAARRGSVLAPVRHPEPLAGLDYAEELALKRDALSAFWRQERLPGRPNPIVAAPVPRGYRSTSKRRVTGGGRGLSFVLAGAVEHERPVPSPEGGPLVPERGPAERERALAPPARSPAVVAGEPAPAAAPSRIGPRQASPNSPPVLTSSALDRAEHLAVYEFLQAQIGRATARPVASVLSWVVVRGTTGALTVILNLRAFDAQVVRAARRLAGAMQAEPALGVRAAFLYLDPTRSDYYLEARRPEEPVTLKRLFGPEWLRTEVRGVRLRFPPTVFSQVNDAMLDLLADRLRELLAPLEDCSLLDLYCGYGLFSLSVGREAARVLGVDLDGPAIAAARANAAHLGCADHVRFLAGKIDGSFLTDRLRAPRTSEVILLDPPRQGTEPGVAEALAARSPRRVVHLCCGTGEIPREVAAWVRAGYRLQHAIPLDLFPGTMHLETVLLLTPSR